MAIAFKQKTGEHFYLKGYLKSSTVWEQSYIKLLLLNVHFTLV